MQIWGSRDLGHPVVSLTWWGYLWVEILLTSKPVFFLLLQAPILAVKFHSGSRQVSTVHLFLKPEKGGGGQRIRRGVLIRTLDF